MAAVAATVAEAREQVLEQLAAVDQHRAQLVDQLEQLAAGDVDQGALIPPRLLALANMSRAAYYVMAAVVAIFGIAAAVVQRHIERDHSPAPAKNDVLAEPVAPATVAAGRPLEGERL